MKLERKEREGQGSDDRSKWKCAPNKANEYHGMEEGSFGEGG